MTSKHSRISAPLLGVTLAALSTVVVMDSVVMPRIGRETRKAQQSLGAMTAALERIFGATVFSLSPT